MSKVVNMGAIRPIHYLGSKLRMLEFINETIDSLDPSQGTVCDLFSGSGTVSKFLSQNRRVVSVDIQEYSRVICSALLNAGALEISSDDFIESVFISDNYRRLCDIFAPLIEYEAVAIASARIGSIDNLYEIIEEGSLLKAEQLEVNGYSLPFYETLKTTVCNVRDNGLDNDERAMVTRYFGGLYFSYLQGLQIDAALETAHQITAEHTPQRDILVAAILSATSDIVNTVGKQFAQPLQVRDSKGKLKSNLRQKIVTDRTINFFERLMHWIALYNEQEPSLGNHEVIRADYRAALKDLRGKDISVIYADPPYTRYHYSRYYHVLETICLRDMPEISSTFVNQEGMSRGVYRKDRHQSPFSIKSQASEAFNQLFEYASGINAPLVLSYSPFNNNQSATPRMQMIDELIDKAKAFYSDVDVYSPGHFTHSKLNITSRNFGTDTEAELLLVCKNRGR